MGTVVGWKVVVVAGLFSLPACQRGETKHPAETIEVDMSTPGLARLVHGRGGRVQRCYREGLAEQPKLTGVVSVALVAGDDGVVEAARVVDDDLANEAVSDCVAQSLVGGQLGAHPQGPMMLAFEFSPGEGPVPPMVLPEPAAHKSAQLVNVQVPAPKQAIPGTPRRPDPPTPAPPTP